MRLSSTATKTVQPCRKRDWRVAAKFAGLKPEESRKKKGFGPPRSPAKASKSKKPRPTFSNFLEAYQRKQKSSKIRQDLLSVSSDTPDSAICSLRGVLLVGFTEEEAHLVRGWFNSIEPAFKIACCREDYLGRSMSEIFEGPDGLLWSECRWQAQKELVPRAAVFSGMTKDEMLGIVEFWSASGVMDPIFSSNVAAVRQKQLRMVLLEIAQAYANNLAPKEENTTAESLKAMVRDKMAAKRQAGIEDQNRDKTRDADKEQTLGDVAGKHDASEHHTPPPETGSGVPNPYKDSNGKSI